MTVKQNLNSFCILHYDVHCGINAISILHTELLCLAIYTTISNAFFSFFLCVNIFSARKNLIFVYENLSYSYNNTDADPLLLYLIIRTLAYERNFLLRRNVLQLSQWSNHTEFDVFQANYIHTLVAIKLCYKSAIAFDEFHPLSNYIPHWLYEITTKLDLQWIYVYVVVEPLFWLKTTLNRINGFCFSFYIYVKLTITSMGK